MKKDKKISNAMQMEFLSLPENVGLARVAIASFAAQLDLTLNDLEEVKVAVSEAVSNAIIHGYKRRRDRLVRLKATLYEFDLEIIIEDEGRGIKDVEQALQPSYSTDPEHMGLGFVFIKSFMDDVQIESKIDCGTRVIMYKNLADRVSMAQEN